MTFDRTNNDGNEPNSEGNAAPDMVVRQSLAAFKTDPPRGLSIKAAYEMGRLGLECALPQDFTPPAVQRGSQDAPLPAGFDPYGVWSFDKK